MNCFCKLLKFIVLFINCLTSIAGIGVIVLGSYGISLAISIPDSPILLWTFSVILALGVVMTIIGFIGCYGAAYENQCLLGTFSVLMLIAVGLDVAGAILLNQYNNEILEQITEGMESLFKPSEMIRNNETIIILQSTLKCCGSHNYTDWQAKRFKNGLVVPEFHPSCCNETSINRPTCERPSDSLTLPSIAVSLINKIKFTDTYYPGCISVIKTFVNALIVISPIVLAAVGVVEVFSFISSLGLCCAIRKSEIY